MQTELKQCSYRIKSDIDMLSDLAP